MAIAPTGSIYKTLTFDGQSSGSYGVYITGNAVFNAPERAVEMITIPGRNGAFALDQGRFENITVSYPAGIFADNEADFAEAISEFRNFLCSRKGYVRLTDDYNPDEYRLAVYKSGLEVEPALLKAGEFEIVFECKPQRFLTSGEEAVSVTSGDTITNPTLFDASPLLEVTGYGDMAINGETITINAAAAGNIILNEIKTGSTYGYWSPYYYPKYSGLYNAGDTIRVGFVRVTLRFEMNNGKEIQSVVRTSYTGDDSLVNEYIDISEFPSAVTITYEVSNLTFSAFVSPGSQGVISYKPYYTITYYDTDDGTTKTAHVEPDYRASNVFLSNDAVVRVGVSSLMSNIPGTGAYSFYAENVILESTVTGISPIYIDLDVGEAYAISGDNMVSVNNAVSLPAQLPKLSPGANTITKENTITVLKITPRYWKV